MLIELLGLTGALLVGAACSATAGVVALVLDRWSRATVDAPSTSERADCSPQRRSAAGQLRRHRSHAAVDRRRLALALAFVSGLTSLGYQVVWNRLLGAGTGSSTYVFTVILVLFLSASRSARSCSASSAATSARSPGSSASPSC